MSAEDAHKEDWAEYWGTRIVRGLGMLSYRLAGLDDPVAAVVSKSFARVLSRPCGRIYRTADLSRLFADL